MEMHSGDLPYRPSPVVTAFEEAIAELKALLNDLRERNITVEEAYNRYMSVDITPHYS